MHIAIVTTFDTDRRYISGGVPGVSRYLADELAKRKNVRLTVISPKNVRGKTTCEQWENFTVYNVGKKYPWSFIPGTFYILFIGKRQIKSLLKKINPDIVHFQGVALQAANCEQPHVLTIHGIIERDELWGRRWGYFRWLQRLVLKLAEDYGRRRVPNIIIISRYIEHFLRKCTEKLVSEKNSSRKTWFIENPIAESYFKVKWNFEPCRIFCCARVVELKNILGMIRAFALIAKQFPNAQLRIAGHTTSQHSYFSECQRAVQETKLEDKVHFLGNISINDVQTEISKSNCLVVPSFQETAPLVISEAMAVGVPVVASRIGGIPDMVEEGVTGYLISPYDIKGIAEAVSMILSDKTLAVSMSQRAKEIAANRFRAAYIAELTMKVYADILTQQKNGANRRFACNSC